MRYFSFISGAPSFEDEDKSRTATLLYFIFLSSLVVNFLATLSDLSVTGLTFETLIDNFIVLVVQVGLFLLMRKGHVRFVAVCFTTLLWLMVAVTSARNSGILNPIFGAELLTIIVAGLLINGWAALIFALLSSLFGLWLLFSGGSGLYVNQVGALSLRETWITDSTSFIFSGVLLFLSLRVIREARNRALQEERSRRESEARLSGIVESAMDAIITIDERQNIVYFNAAAEGMFQCSLNKAVGQPIDRFIPSRFRDTHSTSIQKFGHAGLKNQHMGTVTSINGLRSDSTEFPVEATISQFQTSTGKFYTVILRDITERIQADKTQLEAKRLQLELDKEREVRDLKENFISKMSHEFRTPLAVILSSKETLEYYFDRLNVEQRLEKLHGIEGQIDYMVHLLDDILLIGKAHAGKMQFNPKAMDIIAFCQKYFDQIVSTDKAHHHYVFTVNGTIGEIQADELLLQHILVNLLSNAVKYSPEGTEVKLTLSKTSEGVLIQVSDQGIGIPEADQKHLFEPFYRASNTDKIKGTGLGLALVKESVETHGGTIAYESRYGIGTAFTISLPDRAAA